MFPARAHTFDVKDLINYQSPILDNTTIKHIQIRDRIGVEQMQVTDTTTVVDSTLRFT